METLYQILGILGAGFIVWYMYRNIKGHPEVFSRANLSKSLSSMGVLALILIGVVALLVLLVRST